MVQQAERNGSGKIIKENSINSKPMELPWDTIFSRISTLKLKVIQGVSLKYTVDRAAV